ncbi:BTAD domain-containing putative transcriptional regulator [Streptomyces ehimensis]|uniref:BTAD domain-containing putative transcriptional regulator n=1 Tax=Streptomyces ehimensis TaxID=68195 RepID=A0ABV9BMZ3_9ACTN
MAFHLLGPVEVRAGGNTLDIGGPKSRTVLAALLLAEGRVVSDTTLSEMLWGDNPPATSPTQIQTYVSRLRRLLGEDTPIVRRRPGYLMRLPAGLLDLTEFERLAADGRAALAAGSFHDAREKLTAALALWRGPAMSGVTEHLIHLEGPRLEEARLAVTLDRLDANLALGRHAEIVSELTGLVAQYPLREQLYARLMTALRLCGRQAEALELYHRCRRTLATELGVDPGDELRGLHQRILVGTRQPARPTRAPLGQLPPGLADFVGREPEVARLTEALRPGDGPRPVCVITGMAGIGKTALAVHAAHGLAPQYPDGQLYADLRGTGERPARPVDVLVRLLECLGVPTARPSDGLDRLSALYRSRLTGRRTLLLLDDAADAHQVRPLLPGAPGCAVLVTSRAPLAALAGARAVHPGCLPPDRSTELLGRIIGHHRTAAEEEAARRIAELCGGLPLALRIAGGLLASRPERPLDRLADRLADDHRLLDALRLPGLQLRPRLEDSYRALDPGARRALRLLSLPEEPRFSLWTAAVLLDLPLAVARELVERLLDARLLQVTTGPSAGQDRFSFHRVVRAFARERAVEADPEERGAALERVLRAWQDEQDGTEAVA